MSKTKTAVLYRQKETWVVTLGACLVVLTALYVYFLCASVVHVVIRQEVVRLAKEQQTEVAALESAYMDAQHTLSANVANLDGYMKANDKVFLSRVPATLVLND